MQCYTIDEIYSKFNQALKIYKQKECKKVSDVLTVTCLEYHTSAAQTAEFLSNAHKTNI